MRHPVIALLVASTVSACAVGDKPDQQPLVGSATIVTTSPTPPGTAVPPPKPAMSLTDMLAHRPDTGCPAPYEGFYSRVTLKSSYCLDGGSCAQGQPDINRAPSLLRKLALPRSQTITFIAQVGVSPDVAPVPRQLLLLAHNDNDRENGETSNAELLVNDPALTPYFLVKPETVVSITVTAKHQSKLSSSAVKMLSRVTLQATKLLAPESALATQLAQPAIRAQADNADKWLGLMFSIQDAETISTNLPPVAVSSGGAQVFTGRLLMHDPREYGTAAVWTIGWDAPRISMFSGATLPCEKPTTDGMKEAVATVGPKVDPSQVLGFTIAKDKTIRDLIATQSWYRTASTQLAGTKEQAAGLATFCGQIPGLMRAQNFNRYDAAMILWAAVLDTPGLADPGAALGRAPAICGSSTETLRELRVMAAATDKKQK